MTSSWSRLTYPNNTASHSVVELAILPGWKPTGRCWLHGSELTLWNRDISLLWEEQLVSPIECRIPVPSAQSAVSMGCRHAAGQQRHVLHRAAYAPHPPIVLSDQHILICDGHLLHRLRTFYLWNPDVASNRSTVQLLYHSNVLTVI